MDSFEQLMHHADLRRVEATESLDRTTQQKLGQYFTHRKIAEFMAKCFMLSQRDTVSILDPGAGVGVLAAALVRELLASDKRPQSITVLACEIDRDVRPRLLQTLLQCNETCRSLGVRFTYLLEPTDFVAFAAEMINAGLFKGERAKLAFDYVVLNPPYQKIGSHSTESAHLNSLGLHAPNLYAAFVLLASELLCEEGGQLVAITPRSFCNGTYFKKFRRHLYDRGSIDLLHTFPSRSVAFSDNGVLQENVIFRFVRQKKELASVRVTEGNLVDGSPLVETIQASELVVDRRDPDLVIHIPTEQRNRPLHSINVTRGVAHLRLGVSTGKVVDFRTKENLQAYPASSDVPLIYPQHISGLGIEWPKPAAKKPNALRLNNDTKGFLLVPGSYVIVKRFSSKEERRRIYAAVIEPAMLGGRPFAIENHINYFHYNGKGIERIIARGLAAYLNSTRLDLDFRRFSGHTQVNAGDLARLDYPSEDTLRAIGKRITSLELSQDEIDKIVEEEIGNKEINAN